MVGIERMPTTEERNDFKDVGGLTGKELFLKELAEVEMQFIKKNMPFDAQNAKLDFQDKIENAEKESERKWGYIKITDIQAVGFDDLEKYGDAKRFEIINEDEEYEMVVVNGQRSSIKTGVTVKYKSKNRGFGVSVFMPNDVYEERFGKVKSGDKK